MWNVRVLEIDLPFHALVTGKSWHTDCFRTQGAISIWVRSPSCGCLVTWFCYQLIAKPGNKTATTSWPDAYKDAYEIGVLIIKKRHSHDYLVFIMEIFITKKTVFIFRQGSEGCCHIRHPSESHPNPKFCENLFVHILFHHYLSQCWPRSMSPYSIPRPQ